MTRILNRCPNRPFFFYLLNAGSKKTFDEFYWMILPLHPLQIAQKP